jgi:hypothetical protein
MPPHESLEPLLILASVLAVSMALLHGWGGERLVIRPLRRRMPDATPEDRVRLALVGGSWHLVTVGFVALAAGLAFLATHPGARSAESTRWATNLLVASLVSCAVVFAVATYRRFGSALRLPQWTLFAALAILVAVGMGRPPLPPPVGRGASASAAVVLLVLALLHLYWAAGGLWPGSDRASLARTVVGGGERLRFPTRTATVAVAAALSVAALLVATHSGLVALPAAAERWSPYVDALAWCVAAVFLFRGLGGFFEIYLRPSIDGSPYARWNVILYSPLCLGLAAMIALSLLASPATSAGLR